jgi:hypothetical protein
LPIALGAAVVAEGRYNASFAPNEKYDTGTR